MMTNKYRVREVAKDLGVSNKDVADLLEKYSDEPKKPMTALTERELNIVFEHFSQKNQVQNFDAYFASRDQAQQQPAKTETAAKPAAEKPAAKPAEPERQLNKEKRVEPIENHQSQPINKETKPAAPAAKPAEPAAPAKAAEPARPAAAESRPQGQNRYSSDSRPQGQGQPLWCDNRRRARAKPLQQ
ncbi:MAG: translation initiation factor IF-2 N-terminal domain-containing protein [Oscillospiraceae bacterium]